MRRLTISGFTRQQLLVAEADALDHVDAVVVEHGVGLGDQIVQHALAFRMLQIDRERALIAVEFEKARRKIRILAGAEEAKRVHAAFARFDFDDVGA